jgi:hypothetical protein
MDPEVGSEGRRRSLWDTQPEDESQLSIGDSRDGCGDVDLHQTQLVPFNALGFLTDSSRWIRRVVSDQVTRAEARFFRAG